MISASQLFRLFLSVRKFNEIQKTLRWSLDVLHKDSSSSSRGLQKGCPQQTAAAAVTRGGGDGLAAAAAAASVLAY